MNKQKSVSNNELDDLSFREGCSLKMPSQYNGDRVEILQFVSFLFELNNALQSQVNRENPS